MDRARGSSRGGSRSRADRVQAKAVARMRKLTAGRLSADEVKDGALELLFVGLEKPKRRDGVLAKHRLNLDLILFDNRKQAAHCATAGLGPSLDALGDDVGEDDWRLAAEDDGACAETATVVLMLRRPREEFEDITPEHLQEPTKLHRTIPVGGRALGNSADCRVGTAFGLTRRRCRRDCQGHRLLVCTTAHGRWAANCSRSAQNYEFFGSSPTKPSYTWKRVAGKHSGTLAPSCGSTAIKFAARRVPYAIR